MGVALQTGSDVWIASVAHFHSMTSPCRRRRRRRSTVCHACAGLVSHLGRHLCRALTFLPYRTLKCAQCRRPGVHVMCLHHGASRKHHAERERGASDTPGCPLPPMPLVTRYACMRRLGELPDTQQRRPPVRHVAACGCRGPRAWPRAPPGPVPRPSCPPTARIQQRPVGLQRGRDGDERGWRAGHGACWQRGGQGQRGAGALQGDPPAERGQHGVCRRRGEGMAWGGVVATTMWARMKRGGGPCGRSGLAREAYMIGLPRVQGTGRRGRPVTPHACCPQPGVGFSCVDVLSWRGGLQQKVCLLS